MSQEYSLTFQNNSENNWTFCCYQNDPDINNPGVMSVAWFAFPVAPTTSVRFGWTINYQLVWSQTGRLAAGVMFTASQKWDAGLRVNNTVDFTRKPNGAFTFEELTTDGDQGTLYIHQDNRIPSHEAAIGINMGIVGRSPGAGTATYLVPAQPNISASFTPHPNYWVTFGHYSPGQVLDISQITRKAPIEFPPAVYAMYAILSASNTWTITSQPELNEAFLNAPQNIREAAGSALRLPPEAF